MTWGYHMIVDCFDANYEAITDAKTIEKFARTLVKRIDMVPFGDPQIVHFGEGDKEGYTLVQLIQTSNITAHFVNDTKSIYLDVFSCKPYKQETVIETVREFFNPVSIMERFIER